MAGERVFINQFRAACAYVTAATQGGLIVHRGVAPHGPGAVYVDTDEGRRTANGILYTDSISWCSGVALWSANHAGIIHIVPGTPADEVEDFLGFYDNGANGAPARVYIATQPPWAPPYLDDEEAAKTSLYAAARALVNHYGNGVRANTTIITGYKGRQWSHQARLSVSATTGVSVAIP
jgi:hypothetical protein